MSRDTCQWFARCSNPADGIVEHPILGEVPCCDRCARQLDLPIEHRDMSYLRNPGYLNNEGSVIRPPDVDSER